MSNRDPHYVITLDVDGTVRKEAVNHVEDDLPGILGCEEVRPFMPEDMNGPEDEGEEKITLVVDDGAYGHQKLNKLACFLYGDGYYGKIAVAGWAYKQVIGFDEEKADEYYEHFSWLAMNPAFLRMNRKTFKEIARRDPSQD